MARDQYEYFDTVPKSRTYVHKKCGGCTTVMDNEDGKRGDDGMHPTPHTALSTPTQSISKTYCVVCEDFFTYSDFYWEDTGENIVEYHRRWFKRMPGWAHSLTGLWGCLGTIILILVGTGALGSALVSAWGWGIASVGVTIVGVLVWTMLVTTIYNTFTDKLEKKFYGASDYRLLK